MITPGIYASKDPDPKEIFTYLQHWYRIPITVIYGIWCEQGGMPLMTHVSMPSVMSMPSMMSLPQMTFAQPQQPHQVPLHRCLPSPSGSITVVSFWLLDPRWVKNQDPNSGMNFPDHLSESLNNFLDWNTCGSGIREFLLTRDPGWKKIRIRDKHPGSATLGSR